MEVKLGELILKKGLISRDQLREALIIQRGGDKDLGIRQGERLGRVLLQKGYITPMDLVRVLCEQKGKIDFILVGRYLVEPRVVTWFSEGVSERFQILPLVSLDEDTVIVAATKAIPPKELEVVERTVNKKIELITVEDKDLPSNIKLCYNTLKKRGISGVRIGEILVRDRYITQADLDEALMESARTQRMLGKILIERGKVNETDFFHILSMQKRMPLVPAHDILPSVERDLFKNISKAFAIHNMVAPYRRDGEKAYVVTAEPSLNPEELKKALECREVDIRLSTYSDIELILRDIYLDKEVEVIEAIEGRAIKGEPLEDMPIEEELAPLAIEDIATLTKRYQKVTSNLLLEAIKRRASDIHIESYEKDVIVRFRIDGTLYDLGYLQVNKKNVGGVINVIKVQSNMNIAERRLPQGGRFRKRTRDGNVYDFRLQTQPTLHGENVVIRVLAQSSPLMGFDELGFSPDIRVKYERLIVNPSGLILITGPTGSGKTTTLYSTLGILRKDLRKKIVTIEDPVEYSLERIQQAQVKAEIGYDFAQATRAFLREDPDIMLIGEIRDHETAIEAMRASQTGHLVFSTLHTNNTIESVQRLMDLKIDPNTLAAELLAVISQRLAKRICPECKKEYRPSKELLDTFYPLGVPPGLTFYKGAGCELCGFRGHRGRIAVIEFWLIDLEAKRLITEEAHSADMMAIAVGKGMVPMMKDGLMKVEAGIIPLDELPEIIPYFQIVSWRNDQLRLLSTGPKGV